MGYCILSLLGMLSVANVIGRYWPPLAAIKFRELGLSPTTMGYEYPVPFSTWLQLDVGSTRIWDLM